VVSLKFIQQFGELEWLEEQRSGAEQAAEKPNTGGTIDEKHASGAEARIDFAAFTARLKRIPQERKNPLGSR
jgi:hypothetical protein